MSKVHGLLPNFILLGYSGSFSVIQATGLCRLRIMLYRELPLFKTESKEWDLTFSFPEFCLTVDCILANLQGIYRQSSFYTLVLLNNTSLSTQFKFQLSQY